MEPRRQPDPALVSLISFWADAGVEIAVGDEPVDRLAPRPAPEPRSEPRRSLAAPLSPAPASAPPLAAPPSVHAEALERARALANAAQDWASLQAAVEAFEAPGRPQSAPMVFSRGALSPQVLVIGEGPSGEDEAAGAPFSGRIGALLDRMLAAAELGERALILPTSFWRARDRSAAAGLETLCAPFLHRAIALARPKAVLLVGEAGQRSVLGRSEPILQARGRWTDWRWDQDEKTVPVPALATFHPAFLLQHPAAKKRAWADLLSLADKVSGA